MAHIRDGIRRRRRAPLTVTGILRWADAYRVVAGRWPTQRSGLIAGVSGLTWRAVNRALGEGLRGLPGGSSLARLLAAKRGRGIRLKRRLTLRQIVAWADSHHATHGDWPSKRSGSIAEAPGLNWAHVNQALSAGWSGLPGGSSLARLLNDKRVDVRTNCRQRQLTVPNIVAWADAYHALHGCWPTRRSGPVEGELGVTWELVHLALRLGRHGLEGGSSLAQVLKSQRHARRRKTQSALLDADRILAWADDYRRRHGQWPTSESGPVDGIPGETWSKVAAALCFGLRGLPDGGSLDELISRQGAKSQRKL